MPRALDNRCRASRLHKPPRRELGNAAQTGSNAIETGHKHRGHTCKSLGCADVSENTSKALYCRLLSIMFRGMAAPNASGHAGASSAQERAQPIITWICMLSNNKEKTLLSLVTFCIFFKFFFHILSKVCEEKIERNDILRVL